MREHTRDRPRLRGLATTFLDVIDDLITKRADRRARDLGLVITRIPGTRIQSYRSPRCTQAEEPR